MHQHLLMSEFEYWGVPVPHLTVTSVAPMIMRHGTEQNKKEFLPGIARGEIACAVGCSEPNAGTDLASLRTRAVRDGDDWVRTGSKIWNSGAQRSTHEWLCVRTDLDAPRHRGISVIMVPIDQPGIEIHPLYAWSGYRTNETFFRAVRVRPPTCRQGQHGLDLHHRCPGSRARCVDQRRRPASALDDRLPWRAGRCANGRCRLRTRCFAAASHEPRPTSRWHG